MTIRLVLPVTNEELGTARIDDVHIAAGVLLAPGARLFDFTVGLDAAAAQDLRLLVTHYRMTLREKAWVGRVDAMAGQDAGVGDVLALLAADQGDPLDPEGARNARVSVAAIIRAPDGRATCARVPASVPLVLGRWW